MGSKSSTAATPRPGKYEVNFGTSNPLPEPIAIIDPFFIAPQLQRYKISWSSTKLKDKRICMVVKASESGREVFAMKRIEKQAKISLLGGEKSKDFSRECLIDLVRNQEICHRKLRWFDNDKLDIFRFNQEQDIYTTFNQSQSRDSDIKMQEKMVAKVVMESFSGNKVSFTAVNLPTGKRETFILKGSDHFFCTIWLGEPKRQGIPVARVERVYLKKRPGEGWWKLPKSEKRMVVVAGMDVAFIVMILGVWEQVRTRQDQASSAAVVAVSC